jgi:hypothetical protein
MAILEIDVKGTDRVIRAVDPRLHHQALVESMPRVMALVKREIIALTPRRSGRLSGNFNVFMQDTTSEVKGRISNKTPYGPFVNYGTGIFVGRGLIRPSRAKVLRFVIGGRVLFRASIKGQKGQRFVERGIENSRAKGSRIIMSAIQKVLEGRK